MPTLISSPSATVDEMLPHSWLLQDQQVSFNLSSFSPNRQSVATYISSWLVTEGYNSTRFNSEKVVYVQDTQIAAHLMNQALDYLQRAFCNSIGHYILANKGMETWARVTNYYASYFAVHSLLCLQGRTITRLQFDTQVEVIVVPVDIRNHIFGIKKYKASTHALPWKRYYEIYDQYSVSHTAFELVAREAYVTDPADESIERNSLNYAPFTGFQEIYALTRYQDFSSSFAEYASNLETKASLQDFLIDLQGYASDPERKYFARTLLKIALAADIILSIRHTNPALQVEWEAMHQRWCDFLDIVFPNPSNCYLLNFIPVIGLTAT